MSSARSADAAHTEGQLRTASKPASEDGTMLVLLQAIRDVEAAIEQTSLQIGNAARIASQAEKALLSNSAQTPGRGAATVENTDWSVRMIAEVGVDIRKMAFAGARPPGMHRGGIGAPSSVNELRKLADTLQKACGGLNRYIAHLQSEVQRREAAVQEVTPLLNQLGPIFSALQTAGQERDACISRVSNTLDALVGLMGGRSKETLCGQANEAAKGPEKRRHVRHAVRVPVAIQWAGTAYACHSVDVSEGGMLIAAREDIHIPVGTTVHARSDALGSFSAKVVGRSKRGIHLEFVLPAAR